MVLLGRLGATLRTGAHVGAVDPERGRMANARDLAQRPVAHAAYRDLDRYAVLEPKACFHTATGRDEFLVHPLGSAG